MDIDADVQEAAYMNHFTKMLLQTFRTSVGELGKPTYPDILAKPPSLARSLTISLIWLVWFVLTFFMIVIMLNFLIAVITTTYEKVNSYQQKFGFKHKAELNEECFQLIEVFKELPQYKIIVFSTSKEAANIEDDELGEAVFDLKRYMAKERKELSL